jgi:regulator of protease activity HflC (stomatin/prohibitin superfamily)
MAQQTLDDLSSGIVVDQVILAEKSPPGNVMEAFSSVNNAETQAGRSREDAEKKAREILNGAAGEAYPALLDLIDAYERQLEVKDADAAAKTFAELERVLDGGRIDLEGRPVTASGQVTSIISEARQYRTDVVSSAGALAAEFEAKLPAFKASPGYFVATEWGNAYQQFLARNRAERFFVPPGAVAPEVWLNRDPEIKRREEIEGNTERASTSLKTLSERRSQEFWREQKRVRDEKEEQRRLERERKQ